MSDQIDMKYTFIWKIENFSFCFDNPGDILKSPIFTPNNLNGSKWFLTFCPSYKDYSYEYVSCFLNRCKEDLCDDEIRIYFTIEAIDGNGYSREIKKNHGQPFYRGTSHGWNNFSQSFYYNNDNLSWAKDILTIRCQMENRLNLSESVAITEVEIDKCSFQWKLRFSDCVAGSQTKTFLLSETSQYEIFISAPNDLLEIKVKVAAEYLSSPHFLQCKIILLNQDAVEVKSQNSKHLFDLADGNDTWNFPSLLTKEELGSYLKNDTLSLLCQFSTANGKESSEISSSATRFRINCNNVLTLREDLSNLFTSNRHSDVELRSGSKTFSAHKSLLSVRSPVFSAMFDQDMIEKKSGVVNISDVDPETLESFLKFIYSGSIVLKDSESASKLLMVAEKYQVPSLKETCSIYLMSSLSPGNLCEVLDLAEMLCLKQLKKCALNYFAKHMKEVLVLPQWTKFSEKNTKLSMEIISHVAKNFEISVKKTRRE